MSTEKKKNHLLVRFDAEHKHGPEVQCDALPLANLQDNLSHAVEHYIWDVDDAEALGVLDNPVSDPERDLGTDALDLALREIDVRESRHSPNTPTLVCDPLLAHRMATLPDAERQQRNALLLDVLRRGPAVGLHMVVGLNLLNPAEGKSAWLALAPEVREQFRRVTLREGDSAESQDDAIALGVALQTLTGVAWGVREVEDDHGHGVDCDCVQSVECPACESTDVTLTPTGDLSTSERRALHKDVAMYVEMFESSGAGVHRLACNACGAEAFVSGGMDL